MSKKGLLRNDIILMSFKWKRINLYFENLFLSSSSGSFFFYPVITFVFTWIRARIFSFSNKKKTNFVPFVVFPIVLLLFFSRFYLPVVFQAKHFFNLNAFRFHLLKGVFVPSSGTSRKPNIRPYIRNKFLFWCEQLWRWGEWMND